MTILLALAIVQSHIGVSSDTLNRDSFNSHIDRLCAAIALFLSSGSFLSVSVLFETEGRHSGVEGHNLLAFSDLFDSGVTLKHEYKEQDSSNTCCITRCTYVICCDYFCGAEYLICNRFTC